MEVAQKQSQIQNHKEVIIIILIQVTMNQNIITMTV